MDDFYKPNRENLSGLKIDSSSALCKALPDGKGYEASAEDHSDHYEYNLAARGHPDGDLIASERLEAGLHTVSADSVTVQGKRIGVPETLENGRKLLKACQSTPHP
jgi:hypothetical protein